MEQYKELVLKVADDVSPFFPPPFFRGFSVRTHIPMAIFSGVRPRIGIACAFARPFAPPPLPLFPSFCAELKKCVRRES